jgi:hypothetical protein
MRASTVSSSARGTTISPCQQRSRRRSVGKPAPGFPAFRWQPRFADPDPPGLIRSFVIGPLAWGIAAVSGPSSPLSELGHARGRDPRPELAMIRSAFPTTPPFLHALPDRLFCSKSDRSLISLKCNFEQITQTNNGHEFPELKNYRKFPYSEGFTISSIQDNFSDLNFVHCGLRTNALIGWDIAVQWPKRLAESRHERPCGCKDNRKNQYFKGSQLSG